MKKKITKKFEKITEYSERIRIRPKWKEKIRGEPGKTLAGKLDIILEKYFKKTQ